MAESGLGDVYRDTGAFLEALEAADKVAIDTILAHADLRLLALALGNAALGVARECRDGGHHSAVDQETYGLSGDEFVPWWPGGVFDFAAWLARFREAGNWWDRPWWWQS
jgi:hypothetical protein